MQHLSFDVAVIGAGTAGMEAFHQAQEKGARACLIEAGAWGTTCIRTGCIPSKLLLAAADAARRVRTAGEFGIHALEPQIDGVAVMKRLRAERDHFLRGVLEKVEAIPEDQRLHGRASFLAPGLLQVGGDLKVEARSIVIATGSRPVVPATLQALADRLLTTETVFDLSDVPTSLAVVGAGALGIELALAFARLGVRVAVFDQGATVAGLHDPEVSRSAAERFGCEVDLHLETEIEAEATPAGVKIRWKGDAAGEGVFEYVLAASGRAPALDDLRLPNAELELDDKGVPLHDTYTGRCGHSRIYIAGDADADRPVLHEAAFQGRRAGANAATGDDERAPERPSFSVAFSDPDCAAVGEPLKALGDDAVSATFDKGRGRARIEGRQCGLFKLWARKSDGRLAGGEMVGPGVEGVAQLFAVLVQCRLTAEGALELPYYHPTYAEDLKAALEVLAETLKKAKGE